MPLMEIKKHLVLLIRKKVKKPFLKMRQVKGILKILLAPEDMLP